jgi:hypothetical protein
VTGHEAMTAAGPTYRQLDWWTRKGYLKVVNDGCGSGYARQWSATERAAAATMARLVAAGLTVQAAHRVARSPGSTCELAPGVHITVSVS